MLGLILFHIYVNDIKVRVASYMSTFADDGKLMRKVETDEECKILQDDKLQSWSEK